MKIIYIKSKISKNPQELQVVIEFLRKIDKINELVNPFYHGMLNGDKI